MPNYHDFLMRHGEHGVQAIVELIERNEKIRYTQVLSLEERWEKTVCLSKTASSVLAA